MGADYSFYVKIIETHACTFLALNILAIGRVSHIFEPIRMSVVCFDEQNQPNNKYVNKTHFDWSENL